LPSAISIGINEAKVVTKGKIQFKIEFFYQKCSDLICPQRYLRHASIKVRHLSSAYHRRLFRILYRNSACESVVLYFFIGIRSFLRDELRILYRRDVERARQSDGEDKEEEEEEEVAICTVARRDNDIS